MNHRALVAADLARVAEIEAAVHIDPWSRSQILAVADLLQTNYVGWVAVNPFGTVIAYLFMQLLIDEVEILTIGVEKAQQGKGIGRGLLDAAFKQLNEKYPDINACFLEVRASNASAQALYKHLAFEEVGRRRGYYLDPTNGRREDALILRKHLAM